MFHIEVDSFKLFPCIEETTLESYVIVVTKDQSESLEN